MSIRTIGRRFAFLIWTAFTSIPTVAARADELRILTHPLPPFTIVSDSTPQGLAVDIARAIMRRTGDTAAIHVEPFPRLLSDVQAGPLTAGFVVARTPAREAKMQWVGPIVVSGVYLYKKAGSPIVANTLDDARNLAALGVTRGDADQTFLQALGFTNLRISESQGLDLRKLQLGRVDVTPMSEVVFSRVVAERGFNPEDFKKTGVKLYDSAVYVAFSPDVSRRVVTSWAAALAELESSGAHAALLARYGVPDIGAIGHPAVANGG
jgi:polar amino acid transport system substrate-binding protein